MKKENAYDFQKKLLQIHEPNLRDKSRKVLPEEYMLADGMAVKIAKNADPVTEAAAQDFVDYLKISMGVTASVVREGVAAVTVALAEEAGVDLGEAKAYKGFMYEAGADGIRIYGHDARGTAQALYYLEDMMSFAKAPFISWGTVKKKPMFYPQMVHSSYSLDQYPDEYLARIAHEGRDAILVFTKDVNTTPDGFLDFNELIARAARYGIDVYAYSYIVSNMSPEAPEAEEFYENTYGRLFRECPGLKGVTLVGESVEFPSKDPHVAKGRYFETAVDGIPSDKPSSGWYPCEDYPVWLNFIKGIIRKYNPEADIVFWTYNWGYHPVEARIKLIETLPTDISLQATFEMFEPRQFGNAKGFCADYTLSFEGPGTYFKTEAIAAKRRGIPLYSMTNTGGLTWDLGVIPYQPMPYQWMRRYEAMRRAHDEWGLTGLMESHHYGFYPSFISKLSKHAFLEPRESMEDILKRILTSTFGTDNYEKVDQALRLFSEAIRCYTPTNADQYGAFRVGPSYPFVLSRPIPMLADPDAMFGASICSTTYSSYSDYREMPLSLRIGEEIKLLRQMLAYMKQGVTLLEEAPAPNEKLEELLNLSRFITNSVITGLHAKEWEVLKCRMHAESNRDALIKIYDEMEALLKDEIKNAENTIPLVEQDSRLGWEPSMRYMTDRRHLEWKIRQVRFVLSTDLSYYRRGAQL